MFNILCISQFGYVSITFANCLHVLTYYLSPINETAWVILHITQPFNHWVKSRIIISSLKTIFQYSSYTLLACLSTSSSQEFYNSSEKEKEKGKEKKY